jgi:hypothetical protein
VNLCINLITVSWAPSVKHDALTSTFDYGSRVAAVWLNRYAG